MVMTLSSNTILFYIIAHAHIMHLPAYYRVLLKAPKQAQYHLASPPGPLIHREGPDIHC